MKAEDLLAQVKAEMKPKAEDLLAQVKAEMKPDFGGETLSFPKAIGKTAIELTKEIGKTAIEQTTGLGKLALTPLPGTVKITEAITAPTTAAFQKIQEISAKPTFGPLLAPIKTLVDVGEYFSQTIGESGITFLDIATGALAKYAKLIPKPYAPPPKVSKNALDFLSPSFKKAEVHTKVSKNAAEVHTPEQLVALGNELRRIAKIIKSIEQTPGVRIESVLTQEELALYKQYRPLFKSAEQFPGVKVESLIAETKKRTFATKTYGLPEEAAKKIVAEPLTTLKPRIPAEIPVGAPDDIAAILQSRVANVKTRLDDTISGIEQANERSKIVAENIDTIEATGTLGKKIRPELTAIGKPASESELKAYNVSHNLIKKTAREMIDLEREYRKMAMAVQTRGDALSANLAKTSSDMVSVVKRKLDVLVKEWTVQRYAVNRAEKAYDGAIPKDVIDSLKNIGIVMDGLTDVKSKIPITENIIKSIRRLGRKETLTSGEWSQLGRDVIDQFRLNLFSVSSWTLDFFGNAAEIGAQAISGLGYDLGHLLKGKTAMPATQGLLMSLQNRITKPGALAIARAEEEFGATVGGELVSGGFRGKRGTFYTREGMLATIYDYMAGAPLYAKGAVDLASKRLSTMSYMFRKGVEGAEAAGLHGSARKEFIEKFVYDAPEKIIDDAIERGNKAGFNRELSWLEERIATNSAVRLMVDTFARWPFQFARWGAEMIGYNPKVLKGIANKTATMEEAAEYLTRTATGWGGLYLLNETLYDRIDFRSMEYVHENGNRSRLSNRDPVTTGLWFLATLKGDKEKSLAALKFGSVPGGKIISGEGGMLYGTLKQFQRAYQTKNINPQSITKETTDMVNRMIPGQAILGAVKTLIDPTIREGLGAGLPGVSFALDPVINPATGKPLRPMQKIPGLSGEYPSVLGTPIPGAERIIDPISKLLYRYGEPIYRGLRSPIIGIQPNEMPEKMKREWMMELGMARQTIFDKLVNNDEKLKRLESLPFHISSKIVQDMDKQAAQVANGRIAARYRAIGRVPLMKSKKAALLPEIYKK